MQKILVVEDEPAIADTITYALQSEGFGVEWRMTGAEALAALEQNTFDLLVLDVGLPDQNGFDLFRTIRTRSTVPVIFLTARSGEIDRIVGLELGADDYVPKPFSPRELTARVRAVLRRSGAAAAPMPEIAPQGAPVAGKTPFAIDVQRRKISYFGQALELTRYEYGLLEVLVSRPGWVFTRDMLMDRVWQAPEFSMDRTVDAHIKMLRAKLKKVRPDIDAIETHRGLGYSLRETW